MAIIHKNPDQRQEEKIHKAMVRILQRPLTGNMIVLVMGEDGKPHGYFTTMKVKEAHALIDAAIQKLLSKEAEIHEKSN